MASNPVLMIGYRVPLMGQDGSTNRDWFRWFEAINTRASVIGTNTSTSATAGVAIPLPPSPAGYLDVIIGGEQFKVPYYKP